MDESRIQPIDYESHPQARVRPNPWLLAIAIVIAAGALVVGLALVFNPLARLQHLGYGLLGTPAAPIHGPRAAARMAMYVQQCRVYVIMLLVFQWMFLHRPGGWKLQDFTARRPTTGAGVAAGFIAMLLFTGILASLADMSSAWRLLTRLDRMIDINYTQTFGLVWLIMLLAWVGWSATFVLYGKLVTARRFAARVLLVLAVAAALDLFVAVAVYIPRSQADPYREVPAVDGAYTGIAFAAISLLWMVFPVLWFAIHSRWLGARGGMR